MLSTLQTTNYYKKTPHCIVDIGDPAFTPEQQNVLFQNFPILFIRRPKVHLKNKAMMFIPIYKANNCYPYFTEIFPEFRYLIHIEPDVWIQNESVFSGLLKLCKQQGIALAERTNRGLFCIDNMSTALKEWQEKYHKVQDVDYWAQGKVLEEVYQDFLDLNELDKNYLHNQVIFYTGIPVLKKGCKYLRDPKTLKIISSIHVHRECLQKEYMRVLPSQIRTKPMNSEEFKEHLKITQYILKNNLTRLKIPTQYNCEIPMRAKSLLSLGC